MSVATHDPAPRLRGRDLLRAIAEGTCPVPVELDVPELQLPERVALADYFLVAESLTNVAGCARESGVRVRAALEDVLGGSLAVHSPPGAGTRIAAEIPVA